MKTLTRAIATSALWLTSTALFAHSDLTASSPADGAIVNAAPASIELNFTGDVRLLRFAITGNAAQAVATGFKPSANEQSHFTVALPALEQDSYTVNWAIMGADGHLVEKSFVFTVDAAAQESSGAVAQPGTQSEPHAAAHSGH